MRNYIVINELSIFGKSLFDVFYDKKRDKRQK